MIGAVDHHDVAGGEARQDRDTVIGGRACLDPAHRDRLVVGIDPIDKGPGTAVLDCRSRHRDDVLQRVQEQCRVDELVREEPAVGILEEGAA
jgi:hypothetical protein